MRGFAPVLLGLSGGPDSLCLFYLLLKRGVPFAAAHVDHGWRKESGEEALQLQQLCADHGVKFFLKTLNPQEMEGNLEERCREERLHFFGEICQTGYQAVVLGHHADDQVETVLKRLFEGGALSGMQEAGNYKGMQVLRPLLHTPKEKILAWLAEEKICPFIDATNFNPAFLRARMRLELLPFLTRSFGKEVKNSVLRVAQEAQEIDAYLEEKCASYPVIEGVCGSYLDLSAAMHPVEIKFAIRRFLKRNDLVFSHEELACAVQSIRERRGNKWINGKVYIDRKKIFHFQKQFVPGKESIDLKPGEQRWGSWQVNVSFTDEQEIPSWQEAWKGSVSMTLPAGNYRLVPPNAHFDKWWTEHKVPAIFRPALPLVVKNGEVFSEFLSGKMLCRPLQNPPFLKISLQTYHHNW